MNSLSKIAKSVQMAMVRHSPEILTGIGIAGMITTTILAVRATPKALMLINDRKNEEDIPRVNLTPMETIKVTWTCYIPAAITGAISILCLVGASSENLRRNAALATAYTLSESALREYQEKVIETIGEKKEQVVRDAIAKDKVADNPVTSREVIITENGGTLCYDVLSGRYFKTDIDVLRKAENKLNRQMRDEMYISLNEFYYEIGLSGIGLGDDLGWNIDGGYIELYFSSQLTNEEAPCLVLGYKVGPKYDYHYR